MASMYATSSALDSSNRMNSSGSHLEMPHYINIPAEVFHDLSSNDLSNITSHDHRTVSNHNEMVIPSPPSEQIFQDSLDEDQGIAITSSGSMMMMEVKVEEVRCELCEIEEECTET